MDYCTVVTVVASCHHPPLCFGGKMTTPPQLLMLASKQQNQTMTRRLKQTMTRTLILSWISTSTLYASLVSAQSLTPEPCPNDNNLLGYTTTEHINRDIQIERARISNGGNVPPTPYFFSFCPGTTGKNFLVHRRFRYTACLRLCGSLKKLKARLLHETEKPARYPSGYSDHLLR